MKEYKRILFRDPGLKGDEGAADELVDVEDLVAHGDDAAFDPCQVQQVVDHGGHAAGLGEDDVDIVPVLFRRDGAVHHGLQEALHAGQGRPKLVGHVGHEALAGLLQVLELVRHFVEAPAQLRGLVLPLYGDALGEIALGIALDDVVHVHKGVDDAFGDIVGGEEHQEGGHDADGQRPEADLPKGFVQPGDVAVDEQHPFPALAAHANEQGVHGKGGAGEVALHGLGQIRAAAQHIRNPGPVRGKEGQFCPFFIRIGRHGPIGIKNLYEKLMFRREGFQLPLRRPDVQKMLGLLPLFDEQLLLHIQPLHTGNIPDSQPGNEQQRNDRNAL